MNGKIFGLAIPAAILSLAGFVLADQVTINVTLDTPGLNSYELTGQSAFIQYRSFDSTSGGQLDGASSPGASISFTEFFPPPSLSDYLTFAYFGRVHTLDQTLAITDTSFILAMPASVMTPGMKVEDIFPSYNEATLVSALGTNDSAEFLDLLSNQVPNTLYLHGTFDIPALNLVGDELELVAFIGGVNGDEGVSIGKMTVTVIPEPASLILLAGGSLLMISRRRRA